MATQIADTPYSLAAGEGEQLSWFDATMTLKASAPGLGVIETVIGPGDEPPPHVHESEAQLPPPQPEAAQPDERVVAAEAERVRDRDAHARRAPLVRDVAEAALRTGLVVIDRRREHPLLAGERAEHCLDAARRSQAVAR